MNKNTKENIAGVLYTLAKAKKIDMNTEMVKTYFSVLDKYSDDRINRAMEKLTKECNTFPLPADIIKIIEGTQADQAHIAWAKVRRSIAQVGGYNSVKYDDPAIHSVINVLGGWVHITGIETSEMKWLKKDFMSLYGTYKKANMKHPEYLAGIIEIENKRGGYDHREIVEISLNQKEKIEYQEAAQIEDKSEKNQTMKSIEQIRRKR